MRTLYVESGVAVDLPPKVCVLPVTPLLRELIVTAVAAGPDYEPNSAQARIMSVILDQIGTQPVASLVLPMPTDPRLLRVAQSLLANPADSRDLGEWARAAGASKRTLGRPFTAQTGMSFRVWRQQRRLLHAMELMASHLARTDDVSCSLATAYSAIILAIHAVHTACRCQSMTNGGAS